ncbi:G-type lectin S-receptor-like serine/threonine-protein kinase LECRK3 [Mangifera indica]|uniref:G-type lectin S-receptor-like serine/threonine-protein kinase LECRK3 n=1 Tax=Mangifera indica TaxID=29780 RepID=UPI001CFB7D56|nr:G-type lectin S-receptor-like serine/threonine-protein kinase LECRK3 [Mangifera indica]
MPGSVLYPNTKNRSWSSPSRLFEFGFYQEGNGFSVGIWLNSQPNITVVWTADRDEPPVSLNSSIHFTKDGLLLQTGPGEKKLAAELDSPAVSASMLDSGKFIIRGNKSNVIWESFDQPTDTILGGQSMYSQLTSSKSTFDHSSGQFGLRITQNGELVSYPVNHTDGATEFYWKITGLDYDAELFLSTRGVLKLINGNKTLKILAGSSYSDDNKTVIYRATLDADGILRLYSHHFDISGEPNVKVEWFALKNQCEVKGSCGFNSYCYSNSSEADCKCFPGFDFINPRKRFLGCYRNFTDEEGCRRKEPELFYNIADMENTKLGGLPYAKQSMNKEDCNKSCLYDCHCGAALYVNGTCSTFKLPLMYGMKSQSDSATVFVKWSSGNTGLSIPPDQIILQDALHDRVKTESKRKLISILAASLSSITFLCFIIAISSFFMYKLRVKRYRKLQGNSNLDSTQEFSLQSFSYNELDKATDGFKDELLRDWFGAVYRGYMFNGKKKISVKRLEDPTEEGEKKFREEMATIRQTHHRNLVRLLGFCLDGSRKALVYEDMGKGSLADFIFNEEKRPHWRERVKIALDVARGIHYLHEECEFPIIHRDINSKTILVDESWTAKISNFSLARRLMPNQREMLAGFKGTQGYTAPEWQKNGPITVKSDVYSFGVVLLEIICCRSNIKVNVSTPDEVLLSTWVYNCFVSRELKKLVTEEEVDMKMLERMVKVGLLCTKDDPNLRPSMKNVILMLEGTMDIPVHPCPTLLV